MDAREVSKGGKRTTLRILVSDTRASGERRRGVAGRDELERVAQEVVGAARFGAPRSRLVGVDATNALDAHGRMTTLALPNFFFVVDVGGDGELRAAFRGLFNLFANGVGL